MRIAVKVVPGSSRNAVLGWQADALRVAVSAPAERGRANAALVGVLAAALGVPRSAIAIVAGGANPRKVVEISGLDPHVVRGILGPA